LSKDFIIAVAKIVRQHGITRNEGELSFNSYKAQLFSRGSELLKNISSVYLMGEKVQGEAATFDVLQCVTPPKALGAKWGQSEAVVLSFDAKINLSIPAFIGVSRSLFPKLSEGYYLCDLLGKKLSHGKGQEPVATLLSYLEIKSGKLNVINFVAETLKDRRQFEFPAALIEELVWEEDVIVVPNLEEWIQLSKNPQSPS